MEKFNQLKQVIADAEKDVIKFEAGNSAAGIRVRKAMQEAKVLAQAIRLEVSELKSAKH